MGDYYTGPAWATALLVILLLGCMVSFLRWAVEESRQRDRRVRQRVIVRAAREASGLHPDVASALQVDGSPRFYPPGSHPATARLRLQLERLEEFGWGESDTARYIRDQIAAFEEGESIAKQRYVQQASRA